eukprot:s8883_g2.t1
MSWSSWSSQWPAYSQSSNEKAQWSADSQSSSDTWAHNKWSTPEKQQNTWGDQQWDYASPTGVPYVEGLPDSFKPDKKHLDSKEVYGKTMLRKVAPTSWATIQASSSSNPSQELVDMALDPTHQLMARIFQQYPTQGVAKTNISKWLKNIKAKVGPEIAQSIEKALDLAQQMQPCLDPMIIQQLRDKCAQIGLPVQWATKIKEPEIHQVLIAATCVAD